MGQQDEPVTDPPRHAPISRNPWATLRAFFSQLLVRLKPRGKQARMQAEELLRRRGDEYKLIAEAIPQLVWRTNLDGSADYMNQHFIEYLGYSRTEMMGWGWAGFIHPEDRPKVLAEWTRCRDLGLPVVVDFRVNCAGRGYRWFTSRGNPFTEVTGQTTKYYGVWTDIDDERQARLDREALVSQLRSAVQARDEFLSIASHELKTPLTPLKLQVQGLKSLVGRNPDMQQLSQRVLKVAGVAELHVTRLVALIDSLLDVTRIGSGKLELHRSPMDLTLLAHEVAGRYAEAFATAYTDIHIEASQPVWGPWDALRLEQVLVNLLTNARKYAGGKPVYLRVTRAGDTAILSVQDNGQGIEPENLERVFARFERVNAPHGVGGLGLGLYITRQLVEAHGGTIHVESTLGAGATFVVSLPGAEDSLCPTTPRQTASPTGPQ